DALAGDRLEPLEIDFHRVGADGQEWRVIRAVLVRDTRNRTREHRAGDGDIGAGDRGTLFIGGLDKKTAVLDLRPGRSGESQRQHEQDPEETQLANHRLCFPHAVWPLQTQTPGGIRVAELLLTAEDTAM